MAQAKVLTEQEFKRALAVVAKRRHAEVIPPGINGVQK